MDADHNSAKQILNPKVIAMHFERMGRPLAKRELPSLQAAWDAWTSGTTFEWTRPIVKNGTPNSISVGFQPTDQAVSA